MKRARIVLLRHRYLLGANLGFPEDVGHQGLLCTFVGQMSVSPGTSAIAIELGPIALRLSKHLLKNSQYWGTYVPGRRPVVIFCYIMCTFPMPPLGSCVIVASTQAAELRTMYRSLYCTFSLL